ncbi:MAG: ShlB/FhaC/HecB family hemolysin secretion/activation protein [Methylococcales bacterium]
MEILIKSIIISLLSCLCFQPKASHAGSPAPSSPTINTPVITAPDALSNESKKLPDLKLNQFPQKPEFRLPPVEIAPEKDALLSTTFSVFIKEIRITGNTVFSDQTLKKITTHYENRTVTNEQLQALRYQLTRYYIDQGYINSGVILPDQQVQDGIIQLQVIEGELSKMTLSGNHWLRSSYIEDRIAQSFGPPLNITNVQKHLLLLQQDPLIERINAELHPGLKPGESRMNIAVTEARPYEIGAVAANDRSPSIGGISGKIWFRHRNLTGFGDGLFFSYTGMEGLHDFNGSYSLPLTAYDTRLNLYYQNSDSDVVEKPINDISIESRSETYGIALSHPFYRTPNQTFSATLAFEYRRSKTFLDNQPFSFSLGVPEEGNAKGVSKISVLRFTQEWLDRSQTQVIAARSTLNWGINAFDATHNSNGDPDGQFFTWLGQFQWVMRLPILDSQILFRADAQLANDSLLPLEKFSVGGRHSVRGYRENQFVRDNGATTSLEWRVPIIRIPIPGLSKTMTDGNVQLATFVDFGWSKNSDLASPEPNTIGSWGLGLLWDPSPMLHSELYWGLPFRSIKEGTEHDIQDFGIHFQVNARLL